MAKAVTAADCQSCGACCVGAIVRDRNGVELGRCASNNYCVNLRGKVGEAVSCDIYENRPFVCMAFRPDSEACHNARKRAGLEKA